MIVTTSLRIDEALRDEVKKTGMSYRFLIREGLKFVKDRKELNLLKAEQEAPINHLNRRVDLLSNKITELEK